MCKIIQQYTHHSAFTQVCIISECIHTHCGRVQHYCIRFLWQSVHSHGKCKENNVLNVLWYNVVYFLVLPFAYIVVSKNECASFYLI